MIAPSAESTQGVQRRRVQVRFRAAVPGDLPYVLDSWRVSWRLSPRCYDMRGRDYGALFDRAIRHGVLSLDDTKITIGCDASRPSRIWSWICHTPGIVPTVHYAVTRMHDGGNAMRRLGLFTRLIAAIGVRSELVYTAKPNERTHRGDDRRQHVEERLLDAARRAGITATYHSVEEFLAHRGIR